MTMKLQYNKSFRHSTTHKLYAKTTTAANNIIILRKMIIIITSPTQ